MDVAFSDYNRSNYHEALQFGWCEFVNFASSTDGVKRGRNCWVFMACFRL